MQSRYSAAGGPKVRPVKSIWLPLVRHRRMILSLLMVLAVLLAGATGFIFGNSKPASAAVAVDDTDCVAAFANQLAAENDLCSQIEQINLQEQLLAEKEKNSALEDTLDAQQQEMDSLESTILGALMANLDEQSISRSSKTVTNYVTEAKNLIELKSKLTTFKKTDTADEIDLTEYEATLHRRLDYIPTIKPIPGSYNGFGYRRHPIYGYYHFHPAADVAAPRGTKIKAAASGTIIASTYNWSAGYYITIDHKNGFTTTYMHCSKLYYGVGTKVEKGQVIALVGNTGSSTGPHLHYEVMFYGQPVNPKKVILE